MNNILRTLLVTLLIAVGAGVASAQTATITLGTTTSTGNIFPFNYTPGNGRFQAAYSAAEMAGAAGKYITSLRVYGSTVAPIPTYGNLRIRMAHSTTPVTTLSGTYDANYTAPLATVLGPVNIVPTAVPAPTSGMSIYSFPLASPFLYDGTSNLLIDWSYESRSAAGFSISSATGRSRVFLSSGGGPTLLVGTSANSGNFGIEFTYLTTPDGTAITHNTTANPALALPATDFVAMDLGLSTVTTARDLNSITFTKTGTITDGQVSAVRLMRDNNNNGVVDGTDTQLGTGTLAAGSITFTGAPLQAVTTAAPVRLLLAVSVPTGPSMASTLQFAISSAASVTWSGGTDYNVYPVTATQFVVSNPDIAFARGATAVADGGSDTLPGTFVATVGAAITYTITNPGNAATTITNPASLTGLSNCTVTITTQPATSVAAAGSTSTVLTVTPTAAGAFSFSYALTNSVPAKNPYDFTVNGTATAANPDIAFARGATAIADGGSDTLPGTFVATVGSAVTYTITNPGNAPAAITNPAALTGLSNCTVTITTQPATSIAAAGSTSTVLTITPTAAGAFSFSYALTNGVTAKNPYDFTVNGTATAANPDIAFARGATAIADGGTDTLPGTFVATVGAAITYTITNSGNAPTTITNPAALSGLSNCTVTITTQPAASVAASGSTSTVLSVTPTAAGAFSFSYALTNSVAAKDPYDFTVNGTAVAANPDIAFARGATAIADGGTDTLPGTFVATIGATVTYTITNPGNIATTITNPAALSGQSNCTVTITTQPAASVAAAGSTSTVLTITPTAAGAFSFSYALTNSVTAKNPYDFTVNGTAVAANPDIAFARGATAIADGGTDTLSGTFVATVSATVTYTITNPGNIATTITNPAVLSGLSNCTVTITTQPAASVAAAGSTSTVLTITPTAVGAFSFSYALTNIVAAKNPYDFTVNGTAVAANPDLAALRGATAIADGGTDTLPSSAAGSPIGYTYTLQNPGNAPTTLSNPATIGTLVNCTATITTAPAASIAAAGSTTTLITVTPTAVGAFSFNYSIGNNTATKNPYDFTVNGTAIPPLNGAYVINQAGGAGVDFTSIGAAFDALEGAGVSGPVTLTITDSATYIANSSYTLGINGTGAVAAVTGVSATNTITLRAATGQSPKIQGNATGAVLQSPLTGRGCLGIMTSYVAVEGLEVFGGPNFGILIQGNNTTLRPENNTIRACKVHDIPDGPGIAYMGQNSSYATNILIENNFIWNCFTNSGNPTTSTVLLNNTGGCITIRNAQTGNGVVRHNTILHTSSFGGTALNSTATAGIYAYSSSSTFALNNISNNIVVCTNATVAAIYLYSATSNPTPANCNFNCWNSTVFLARAGAAVTFATWQAEARDANGTTANPLLASTSTPFDLHLLSSSPCINPAGQTSTLTVDIDGDARPVGATTDIGADEANATPTAPSITSGAPANGVVGTAYSHTFTATGTPATFTWTVSSGSLPTGLTLNASSGLLSGSPTTSGNYSFVVNCSNGTSPDATQNVNMAINQAPAFSSAAPANGLLGSAYSHTFTATGFPATFTFTVTAGTLPTGLNLAAATGVLSGTPSASGNFSFTVTCSNGISPDATQNVNMAINEAPTITSSAPGAGNVGVAYSHSYTATGFPTTFTWTVSSGALPGGLTLNASSGVLNGTPTAPGTFNGVVTCSNGIGTDATQAFSIVIASALQAPTFTSGAPANALLGAAYSHTFQASGNPATFTWTVTAGSIPAGLTLNASSGVLSGTPTASGAFSFTVTCANGVSPDATQNVNMNVNEAPAVTSSAPASGLFGTAYSHTFTASGFPASFTWSVISGSLPGGLALGASTGVLSGTPTAGGAFSFTVQASNGVSPNGTQAVNLTINRAPSITSGAPANAVVGTSYSHTFTAIGFPVSYTWTISAGALPGGLSLGAATGVLSGTPTASGAFSFTVTCANGISPNATQAVNMNVNQAPSITSSAPANGLVGTSYSHTFTATGFPATFTWTVSAGALPGGLTLGAATGVLSGTPTASGAFSFTVTCANGVSPNATQAVNMSINQAPSITSGAPANGVVGTAYSHTFTATGFPATFTWTVSAGALPGGLTLGASTGVLSGTPSASGAFSFTVTCANGVSPDATQAVNMNVNQAPTITSAAPPNGSLSAAYTHTFTATGFPATFTWTVSAGTLPAGLTLAASTGVLSGTPTAIGASSFTVSCANGVNPAGTQNVNMNVTQGPAITSGAPASAVVGVAYSHTFTATGFPATYTWTVTAGTLPAGLVLAASTGVLSGTPTAAGASSFTVTCSNGVAPDATQNVNMQVNEAPTITSAAPPAGATFVAYNHTCTATGTPATFTWSVSAGALPGGLTLNASSGVISGTPAAVGNFTGTITCANGISPNAAQAFNITITATPAPIMAVMRGATAVADGGTDALGNSTITLPQSITYTITNTGTAALSLTGTPSLVVTGGATNVTGLAVTPPASTTVPASASVTFTVQFSVPAAGAFSFTLSIDNSDPATNKNPYNWTVNGTGVTAPEIGVARGATAVADGGTAATANVTAGFSITVTFTISNTGNAPLSVTTPLTISGNTNCTATVTAQPNSTVAAGGSTTFTVSVLGGTPGAYSFNVSITNNDADENPYNFTCNGTVVAPGGSTVGGGGSGGGGGGGCSSGEDSGTLLLVAGSTLILAALLRRRRQQA